jgi:hypothetical protein
MLITIIPLNIIVLSIILIWLEIIKRVFSKINFIAFLRLMRLSVFS